MIINALLYNFLWATLIFCCCIPVLFHNMPVKIKVLGYILNIDPYLVFIWHTFQYGYIILRKHWLIMFTEVLQSHTDAYIMDNMDLVIEMKRCIIRSARNDMKVNQFQCKLSGLAGTSI